MSSARQRPAGLILAAVVLGLFTIYGFFNAAVFAITALYIRVPQPPSSPVAPTSLISAVQFILAFITLAISTFSAFTVFGLFRFKQWARFSIIIFGGLLAIFSAMSAVLFLVLAFRPPAFPQTPQTAGLSPSGLRTAFLIIFAFSCIGVLIGCWWLVYFNLRSTRALFANSLLPGANQSAAISPSAPVASRHSVVEILVMCLAVLYLLTALSGLFTVFTRTPLYLLGFIIRGTAAVVTSVALILLSAAIGIGLLRRFRAAWTAALVFDVFGFLSGLLLLLPANRASFASYQQEIMQRLTFAPAGAPTPQVIFGSSLYVASSIIGLAGTAAVAWLLIRARPLFQHQPQPE